MALDMSFANTAGPGVGSGVLAMPTAAPAPPMAGVLGPASVVPPVAQPQQPTGGNPFGGIAGVLGGLASIPGNYVGAMGAQFQDAAASHQMHMQMAQAQLANFKAQMAGLQEVRQGISDPKEIALFDADPFAYAKSAQAVLEATRTPQKLGPGDGIGTAVGGISTFNPVVGVTPSGVGYSLTPDGAKNTGSFPTVQDVAPGHTISPLAPLGVPANGINGGFAGIPSTPAPAAGDVATDPGSPAPAVTGGISPGWAARALTPQARTIATQIASHPDVAGLDPQDQANILTTGFRESAFNPKATNGSSSHLFQFQDKAWQQFGSGDPNDVNNQIAAEVKAYAYDKNLLTHTFKRPPTGAELYMTAMQGPGGGPALLTAAPGTPAVTALRNIGLSSATALQSIAANLPGYNYHTAAGRQAANSAAMKMTAQDFTNTWAGIYNKTQAAMFSGAHGAAQPPSAPQAGNVWANGNAAAPGGPTMSVSGQPVPAPPAPPAGNGSTYPTSLHSQAGDKILTADQVTNGQPGWTYKQAVDGSLTPIAPVFDPVATAAAFAKNPTVQQFTDIHRVAEGFSNAISNAAGQNNGVLGATGVDAVFQSYGLNPRVANAKDLGERMGLPEAMQAKVGEIFGKGGATVAGMQQMFSVIQAEDQAARTAAQRVADSDTAVGGAPYAKTGVPGESQLLPPTIAMPSFKAFEAPAAGPAMSKQAQFNALQDARMAIAKGAPRAAVLTALQHDGVKVPAGF